LSKAAQGAAGARGYILKGATALDLVAAVRALHCNDGYVSPALGAMMLANASHESRVKRAPASALAQLTFREGAIFKLLAAGLKNREIGRRLGVTDKSIKIEKLHAGNRVEAAMLSRPRKTSFMFMAKVPTEGWTYQS
jgi:DNA-binding NarL/FixJ family response regulator